jgi:hypothetical protein
VRNTSCRKNPIYIPKKNINLEFIEEPYYHINHGHTNILDGVYNTGGYENKENWGFIDYKKTELKTNVTIIY